MSICLTIQQQTLLVKEIVGAGKEKAQSFSKSWALSLNLTDS